MSKPTRNSPYDGLRWRRIAGASLAGIAAVLGVAALVLSAARPSVDGDALLFDLVDLDGNWVSPKAERFAGKVLLVDIWGLWCGPCVQQIPYLIDLQRRYGPRGLEIIGVEFASYDGGDPEQYRAMLHDWATEQGINYTVVSGGETPDVESVFPTLRNFNGFPTSLLIGRDGRVRLVSQGFAPSEMRRFEALIKQLLNEPAPAAM